MCNNNNNKQKKASQNLEIIDFFHIDNEKQFIEHMETKELINPETKKKDLEKINKPINFVSIDFMMNNS